MANGQSDGTTEILPQLPRVGGIRLLIAQLPRPVRFQVRHAEFVESKQRFRGGNTGHHRTIARIHNSRIHAAGQKHGEKDAVQEPSLW